MKHKKLTAALVAAMTAVMPFTLNTKAAVPDTAYADEGKYLTDYVEWIPKDYNSVLEFLNTYGATHIEAGVLCVVFQREYEPLDPVNYVQNLRYRIDIPGYNGTYSGNNTRSYTYSENPKKGDTEYVVFALSNFSRGEFAVEMTDSYISSAKPVQSYSFLVDDEFKLSETDIYGWLPDCEKEFRDYTKKNGQLSVKDNYVVFGLSNNAGTPYNWTLNDKGTECFELAAESDCSPVTDVPLDGGMIDTIYAYKAVKDGYDKISYDFKSDYSSNVEENNSLVADCAVYNDAQNILLSGDMRVSLVDYDTGELLTLPEGAIPRIWTDISKETTEGVINCNMQPVGFGSNPAVVQLGNFFDDYNFSFGLNPDNLPVGYSLPDTEEKSAGYYNKTIVPEDHMTVAIFDNNSADVVFKLKSTSTGDINGDGEFNVADAVVLQKWLLGSTDVKLTNWKAADFCNDNVLNVFDLIMLRRELIKHNTMDYIEPDERFDFGTPFVVIEDGLKLYSGPDESYKIITSIPSDSRMIETGIQKNNNTWLFTEYNGMYGWINTLGTDGKMVIRFDELAKKPVIYLYPEQETDVHVELELTEAELSTTYPKYNNGWDVVASPDGSLLNKADGTHHKYLFWDAVNCRTRFDFSKGFCVAGKDTENFLKEKLTYMGLTEAEMNEFIVYWLPLMEHNAYNLISFQGDAYTNSAKLNITPEPDSMLRIFMAYVPLENSIDIEPQQLETFERKGFTVVEWGGSDLRY